MRSPTRPGIVSDNGAIPASRTTTTSSVQPIGTHFEKLDHRHSCGQRINPCLTGLQWMTVLAAIGGFILVSMSAGAIETRSPGAEDSGESLGWVLVLPFFLGLDAVFAGKLNHFAKWVRKIDEERVRSKR